MADNPFAIKNNKAKGEATEDARRALASKIAKSGSSYGG